MDKKVEGDSLKGEKGGLADKVESFFQEVNVDRGLRERFLELMSWESLAMIMYPDFRDSGVSARKAVEEYGHLLPDTMFSGQFTELFTSFLDDTPSETFFSLGIAGLMASNLAKREIPGGVSNGRLISAYTKNFFNKVAEYGRDFLRE